MTIRDTIAANPLPRVSYIVVDEAKLEEQAKRLQESWAYVEDQPTEEIVQAALYAIEVHTQLMIDDIGRYVVDDPHLGELMKDELDRIAARRDKTCKCVHFAGDLSCCPRHGVAIEDAPEVLP